MGRDSAHERPRGSGSARFYLSTQRKDSMPKMSSKPQKAAPKASGKGKRAC